MHHHLPSDCRPVRGRAAEEIWNELTTREKQLLHGDFCLGRRNSRIVNRYLSRINERKFANAGLKPLCDA